MGKITKLALRVPENDLPENLSELLCDADEGDLRLLIAAMLLARKEGGTIDVSALGTLAGLDQTEVDASLKFWRGAGILGPARSKRGGEPKGTTREREEKEKEKKEAVPAPADAHRNGALERTAALGGYSSAELAALMESRRVSAQFIDEAQRVMGKIFRAYDVGILVGIVDQLGFEEAAVLGILGYAAAKGKKTLRYAEQMALAFYDEGLTDTGSVMERLSRMERAAETVGKIKTLFGMGSRELTATEKRLFTTWTERYAYDLAVVRLAYDITVDTIQKPVPKYAGSILDKWHAEGLRTAEEVRHYIEKDKQERAGGEVAKSYDVEDFFEAALRRSYEDLK